MPPSNKILLVEGRDDEEVIYQISNHAGIAKYSFTVERQDGFDKVMTWITDVLPRLIKASEPQEHFIGILVDADENAITRWQSITDRLKASGYHNLPSQPQDGGIILTQEFLPKLGIWLMPNNQAPGILEDFIASLVPSTDLLWSKAQACVDSIPFELRRFKGSDLPKTHIHTWLAWQENPGTPLGLAIIRKQIDVQSPQLLKLIEWLRRLFEV